MFNVAIMWTYCFWMDNFCLKLVIPAIPIQTLNYYTRIFFKVTIYIIFQRKDIFLHENFLTKHIIILKRSFFLKLILKGSWWYVRCHYISLFYCLWTKAIIIIIIIIYLVLFLTTITPNFKGKKVGVIFNLVIYILKLIFWAYMFDYIFLFTHCHYIFLFTHCQPFILVMW